MQNYDYETEISTARKQSLISAEYYLRAAIEALDGIYSTRPEQARELSLSLIRKDADMIRVWIHQLETEELERLER